MDLIFQNPFRILGIPVTATDREIAKQIGSMELYADMGKTIEYDSDHFFPINPPEQQSQSKKQNRRLTNQIINCFIHYSGFGKIQTIRLMKWHLKN